MSSVEDRLAAIESEIAILRQRIVADSDWLARVSGSLKEFPEFEDVLRLGREAREREKPSTLTDGC